MKTSSAKNKGRVLQQLVRDVLLKIGQSFSIMTGDVTSTSMGAQGVDVILSPFAQKVFGNLAIECKNVEALNVPTTFWGHSAKYPGRPCWLVHKKNNTKALVTLPLDTFIQIFEKSLECQLP